MRAVDCRAIAMVAHLRDGRAMYAPAHSRADERLAASVCTTFFSNRSSPVWKTAAHPMVSLPSPPSIDHPRAPARCGNCPSTRRPPPAAALSAPRLRGSSRRAPGSCQRLRKAVRSVAIVDAAVVHGPPQRCQFLGKMPHRAEEQHNAGLAAPRLSGLLRHPHGVHTRIETVEGARCVIELIAEHEDEVSQPRLLRHASEQCFTSSHCLAHDFRQTITLPQITQSL